MTASVAIIGAGWYGCHIASSLGALGFETTVFEQCHLPRHEVPGNNQSRRHLRVRDVGPQDADQRDDDDGGLRRSIMSMAG